MGPFSFYKTYNLTIIIIIRLQFVMICSRQHSFSIYLDWLMVSLSARCWVRLYSLSLETLSVQWIPSICLYDVDLFRELVSEDPAFGAVREDGYARPPELFGFERDVNGLRAPD